MIHKSISDWTNPENYTDAKTTGLTRWAFEFLRRNHGYQRDFLEYLRMCSSIVPGFNPYQPGECNDEFTENYNRLEFDPRHLVYDPPRHNDETELEWASRVEAGKLIPLSRWYAAKWGLNDDLFDPFADYPGFISFVSARRATSLPSGDALDKVKTSFNDAFLIDYQLPLNAQIDAIKRWATVRQKGLAIRGIVPPRKEKRNPRGETFKGYLRCLDAVDSGVSYRDISAVLLPHVDNASPEFHGSGRIRKQIVVAEELRHSGYRSFLVPGK